MVRSRSVHDPIHARRWRHLIAQVTRIPALDLFPSQRAALVTSTVASTLSRLGKDDRECVCCGRYPEQCDCTGGPMLECWPCRQAERRPYEHRGRCPTTGAPIRDWQRHSPP